LILFAIVALKSIALHFPQDFSSIPHISQMQMASYFYCDLPVASHVLTYLPLEPRPTSF